MSKTLVAAAFAGLFAATSFAADAPRKGCCAARIGAEARTTEVSKLRCSLTGKLVDKCCCTQKEGKTHCTLADKSVEKCCCAPAKSGETK